MSQEPSSSLGKVELLANGREPDVLVIPYPAEGHPGSLMKLSMKIPEHGIKVRFVSTEQMEAKSWLRWQKKMKSCLNSLIEKVNASNDCEQIKCVIADVSVGWALEVAEQMGTARAAVIRSSPANLALFFHIPKLVEAGILDSTDAGNAMNDDELILLSEKSLPWKRNEYKWSYPSQPQILKMTFGRASSIVQSLEIANWVLYNSFNERHPPACDLTPYILTIGPLLTGNNHSKHSAINFWPEDSTCLSWLDKQARGPGLHSHHSAAHGPFFTLMVDTCASRQYCIKDDCGVAAVKTGLRPSVSDLTTGPPQQY
ncbi:glucosyl transferase [Citrus sinensis]|uniref:Glucosyl transferase n=1 Tax=Citrus sinensis TaxID=2711 RepID=A0ACB8J9S8_CITSI|nr:glucosyl transferase [Citrus sinensis]